MKKKSNADLKRHSVYEYNLAEKMAVVAVLDNVRSMNNVGSFFRTCDGFAVDELILCGITGTPPHTEIRKTALGAEDTVRWRHYRSTQIAITELIAEGYTPIAVEQVEGSKMLHHFIPDKTKKYALIFGNEVNGVDQAVVDMCADSIEIPQSGTKHSLNVAITGGVVLWHFYSTPWQNSDK